jgi:hypothetical protein
MGMQVRAEPHGGPVPAGAAGPRVWRDAAHDVVRLDARLALRDERRKHAGATALLLTPSIAWPRACTQNLRGTTARLRCSTCLRACCVHCDIKNELQVFHIEGWRFAMRAVSSVSFLVGASIALLASDPRASLPPLPLPRLPEMRVSVDSRDGGESDGQKGEKPSQQFKVKGSAPFSKGTEDDASLRMAGRSSSIGLDRDHDRDRAKREEAGVSQRLHGAAERSLSGQVAQASGRGKIGGVGGVRGMLVALGGAAKSIREIMGIRTFQIIVAQARATWPAHLLAAQLVLHCITCAHAALLVTFRCVRRSAALPAYLLKAGHPRCGFSNVT